MRTSVNIASSAVRRDTVPSSPVPSGVKATWKTGPRPSSSAVTSRPEPSGSHAAEVGQRSQLAASERRPWLAPSLGSPSDPSPARSGTTARLCSGAACGVVMVSRTNTTQAPSGEMTGEDASAPGSSTSVRRSPVAVSTATRIERADAPGPGTDQEVTSVVPSADRSAECSRSAGPTAEVTSRSSTRPAGSSGTASSASVSAGAGSGRAGSSVRCERSATNRCGSDGPRSWSQYRTGYPVWRIAATFLSLRALRSSASWARSRALGRTSTASERTGALRATSGAETPAGAEATMRASPPAAGRSHRAEVGSPSVDAEASLSGRADVKSRSPSAVKAAPDSPLVLRVRRRAGASPVGSTSHSAETYAVRFASSVDTLVTSRRPSGDITRPPVRGIATYWSRSWKGVVPGWCGAFAESVVTAPSYHDSPPAGALGERILDTCPRFPSPP
ncbi:hypothetical protein D3C74_279040 [compost metagenome]